ncbi:MAG: hypothetical protein JRJ00_00275 [Deltaproteobacteria bacterium]|nr:hypothetical protein [Deltaproteobacteria bacterium]
MAATVEEIQIVVEAQVNDAVRGLNTVERESTSMARQLSKTAKFIAGAAVTGLIVKSFIDIGKQSLKAASDAEETYNKFSVVFASVADEAEASADRIKDEFKLSDETIQNFLSGVGDITSGLGATSEEALKAADDITRLGLDINSFANLSGGAEQAVSALTSLFTGEREAAKSLGIVINDTNLKAYAEDMGKVFKELTPLEKGFLSLELATKQSELAIGDFARSSDSYANTVKAASEATKDLKAALGVSLLPTATEAVGIFSKLAEKMAEVVKEHNELQAIVGRFDAGTASAQDRVDIAQKEVELLRSQISEHRGIVKELNDKGVASKQFIEDENIIINGLIDELRLASDVASHYSKIAKAEKEIADAEKNRLAELERITKLELEASSILDSRRKSRLTDEELLLTNLQQQIDYWAGFRDVIGAQELLNDLIEERNELLDGSNLDKQKLIDDAEYQHNEMARIRAEYFAEGDKIRAEQEEKEKAFRQNIIDTTISFAETMGNIFSTLASLQSAITQQEVADIDRQLQARLEASGLAEETKKEALERELATAISTGDTQTANEKANALERLKITEEFEKKKADALYQGALASWGLSLTSAVIDGAVGVAKTLSSVPFPYNIPLAAIQGGLAAAQVGVIAANKPTPAFAQGGSFLTNGTQDITVGDNAGGVERVTVEPVSSVGANQQQGTGAGSGTMILNINGQQFTGWLQDQFDNGELRVPRRNVV